MGLSQSRGMKLWDVLYPVCIYFVVTAVTAILLDYVLPESVDSRLLRQLLTSFAALPFLYSFYRQDVRMQGELSMGAFGKPPKTRPLHLLVMFFTGGLLALALNNLLGLARIAEHSAAYRQVEQTFYTGRLALEIFALCAVIPLVEELLYRGIVYGRLRRWLGAAPAMLLSALIFGLIHMNLAQFIYASLFRGSDGEHFGRLRRAYGGEFNERASGGDRRVCFYGSKSDCAACLDGGVYAAVSAWHFFPAACISFGQNVRGMG